MAGFEMQAWIDRSPQEVFDFITDPTNAPRVVSSVTRMEQITPGPIGVGTRYHETRLMNGKEAQAELEIARFEPPSDYAMRNETNGIETIYHYTFTPDQSGTRVDLVCQVNAGGLKKAMLPMVVSILKKEDGDHLERLKASIEAQPSSPESG